MKRVIFGTILTVVILNIFSTARALPLPELLIVEIQTGSKLSAGEEFIRIANTTSSPIDLTDKRLEYFSANPKDINIASRTIKLSGSIKPKSTFLLASKDYKVLEADLSFNPTLAAVGGHIRISDGVITNPNIYDFVGWGTAQQPRVAVAEAPKGGEVLTRKTNNSKEYIFTDNNAQDFTIFGRIVPKTTATARPKPKPRPSVSSSSPSLAINKTIDYSVLRINELMPNPASPLLDSKDEYIEIYNSGTKPVNMTGLKLLVGSTLKRSYTFKSGALAPKQYRAYYITETRLTLSNTEGKAQLRAGEKVISETASYTKAKDGMSFSFDGSKWRWTSKPTPNAVNVFSGDSEDGNSTGGSSILAAGSAEDSKADTTKKDDPKQSTSPVHPGVIAGVGSLGILYGIYEYRTDIANFFQKFRRNRGVRSEDS